MPEPILLLRLEGPLQSWGVRSRWDVRDTGAEPSKSGIIGLLGCALGYPMYDTRLETELDAGLRFGVRVENAGRILRDFQTITDFLPTAGGGYKHGGGTATSLEGLRKNPDAEPATILSPRFYLEDAAFLVALSARTEHTEAKAFSGLLDRCAEAVQRPCWPLFLGRKACPPTRPIFEAYEPERYGSLEEALSEHPWSWLGSKRTLRTSEKPGETLTAFVEDASGNLTRQDSVQINPARVYGFRSVREFSVKQITESEETTP